METVIVLLVLGTLIYFSVRKTIKMRKTGGCSSCSGCQIKDQCQKDKKYD